MIGWLRRVFGAGSRYDPADDPAVRRQVRRRREAEAVTAEARARTEVLRERRTDGMSRSPIGNRVADRRGGS